MKLLNFAFHACILSREFIIKFGYNARSHWLKERAISEYRSWAKAITPIAKLYYVPRFPGLDSQGFLRHLKIKFQKKRAGK